LCRAARRASPASRSAIIGANGEGPMPVNPGAESPPGATLPREARSGLATTSRRLLLRHAVERAEPEHQVAGMDADHAPAGEELGERLERLPVARVVEGRDQHGRVPDE